MSRENVLAAVKVLETVLRKWRASSIPVPADERAAQFATGQMKMSELVGHSTADMLELALEGFRAYETGNCERAKAIFTELQERDETQPIYSAALGAACLALDELDDAEEHLTRAISQDDQEIPPLVNRGVVFLRQGRYRDAVADLELAARLGKVKDGPSDPLSERARLLAAAAQEVMDLSRESGMQPPVPELASKPRAPKRVDKKKK